MRLLREPWVRNLGLHMVKLFAHFLAAGALLRLITKPETIEWHHRPLMWLGVALLCWHGWRIHKRAPRAEEKVELPAPAQIHGRITVREVVTTMSEPAPRSGGHTERR